MEKDRDESRRVQEARPEVPDAHVRARITDGTGQELSRPVAPCAFGLAVLSFLWLFFSLESLSSFVGDRNVGEA